MAGTLTISTLSDGTNSTSSTNCIQGSAKAWVNYDGVNKVIRASYNVSSVTYNSTGDYTVNLTNALADANYTAVASGNTGVAANYGYFFSIPYNQAPTTTTVRLYCNTGSAAREAGYTYVALFR